jgi:hypothetical protein
MGTEDREAGTMEPQMNGDEPDPALGRNQDLLSPSRQERQEEMDNVIARREEGVHRIRGTAGEGNLTRGTALIRMDSPRHRA